MIYSENIDDTIIKKDYSDNYKPFCRGIDDEVIDNLVNKNNSLFHSCLKPDIEKCEVFPAIRNNEVDFYYKGGRIFRFDKNKFISNIKYAFVCCDVDNNGSDISESRLRELKRIDCFEQGYKQIKQHCEKYNKFSESDFVSRLFKNYSYINPKNDDDIILLDIESAFVKKIKVDGKDKYEQDRFDIVLLDKKTNYLKVVEAKLYSNDELHNLSVVKQIQDYEDVIKREQQNIIKAYNNYAKGLNKLFGELFNVNIPEIVGIHDYAGLLFFDYDGDNKNASRFKTLLNKLKSKLSTENKIYYYGDTAKLESLRDLF